MELKIEKFRIESDKSQFILYTERKKGTFTGQEKPQDDEMVEEVVGYYSTLESCLKCLPSRMLMRSNATSLF